MSTKARTKNYPVGSKMNDGAYPFRGSFKLDKEINHGHSGVTKNPATSLALRISGSNLVVEEMLAPKGFDLACEVGIDGGVPRPVALSGGKTALAVPGDGREYNLTAILKNDHIKHFCKMSFNGSEGKSYFKLRAPLDTQAEVYLLVDGRHVYPRDGWFHIPLQAKDCVLVVDVPDRLPSQPSFHDQQAASFRRASLPFTPNQALLSGPESVAPNFIVETVRGAGERAVLQCSGTGQMIPLNENQAVAIPANVGPYRLQLPAAPVQAPATPAAVPDATAAATPAAPVAAAVPGTPAATPAAAATATPAIPELETRVTTTSIGSMPAYVVTCKGFYVQLKADNGTNVSGFNTATLQLSNRYAQRVMITITDAGNKTILKQTSYVPATQAPAITLRLTEDANGMTVTGPDRCTFTVGSTKTNGTVGARLTRASTQRVTAEQIHMDGSASSVSLDVGAKPGASMYSGATTAPGSSTVMSQAKPEEQWIAHLAAAVNAPNMDEARRNMQQVRTPNSNASQVVAFINDVLFKQPPTITFTANPTTLSGIQCAGYNISATIGTQQPCLIPTNSQVSVPSNTQATLTAVHAKNGRPVAACRVLLSTSGTGASMTTPNTSVSGPSDMDAKLMARLLEGLQRSGLDPQRAADDFHSVDASPYSYTGQRVLPLLVNTLRRSNLSSAPEKEQFFFTCCNGHLANVYTTHAHYQLSATIDNQAPVSISQRGRVPANGQFTDDQPHFVRLVARDPVTNAVKGDTTVSVMGTGGGDRTNSGTTSSPAGFQSANPYSQYTPSSYPSMQQRETMPSQQSDGYTAPTSVTSQPYMDVSLQQSGPDCIARLTCPSHLRIVCNVDGTGGDTGRSDFAAKVSGDRPHRVEVSLLDSMGKVVFQQKLDIPSMCSSNVWGLALQENGLALDPDAGCSSTVLLDRDPERAVQGGFIGFDATVPHLLVLRKYISGVHGAKTGELLLRLPGSASPKDLLELIRLYRGRAVGQLDDAGLKRELFNLHNRCTAPSVKELISLLTGSTFSPQSAPYNPERGQVATLATTTGGTGDPNRVYFRLTGNC